MSNFRSTASLNPPPIVIPLPVSRQVEAFRYGHTVLGGDDGTARLWNVKTGKQLKNWDYGGRVYSVKFTPNGRHMLTASDDATAVLYDLDP